LSTINRTSFAIGKRAPGNGYSELFEFVSKKSIRNTHAESS
jgi:hypothetical protein